MPDNGYAKLL